LEARLSGHAEVRAPSHEELDVTDDAALGAVLAELRPDVVFNCAAFHNVGVCEEQEDRAFEVNARAVKRLAEGCREQGRLVHVSTNYAFDGRREEPYGEHDLPSPRSVYAISKHAGEHMALAYCPNALVVRTAGLYGLHGSGSKGGNFVMRMVAKAKQEGAIAMVADQSLTPTYTADLAKGLIEAVDSGIRGLLHLTNAGACSWFEFTEAIMQLADIEVSLEATQTNRAQGGPDRPLNGVLARQAADAAGLTPLRHWREALADYMRHADLAAAAQPS
jgi:dTDP-4-dehydrorhamnose reductase